MYLSFYPGKLFVKIKILNSEFLIECQFDVMNMVLPSGAASERLLWLLEMCEERDHEGS